MPNTTAKHKVPTKKRSAKHEESIRVIFEEMLKDMYWAEKHLLPALSKLSKECSSGELRKAFLDHYSETEGQVARLEEVFSIAGRKAAARKCDAMEGLIEECNGVIEEHEKGTVRDVALIICAQKVEHYEIATYGSLRTLAEIMGLDDAVDLLQDSLNEEAEADNILTRISKTVNAEAFELSELTSHNGVSRDGVAKGSNGVM